MRQGPGDEGRVRHVRLGGQEEPEGARGEERYGWAVESVERAGESGDPAHQKLGLCFLSSTIRW